MGTEARRGRFNGSQRSFKLMRDCVEQRGLELFALTRSFGPAGGFGAASSFQSEGQKISERFKRRLSDCGAPDGEAADGLPAKIHWKNRVLSRRVKCARATQGRVLKRLAQSGSLRRPAPKDFVLLRIVDGHARGFEYL